MKFVLKEVIICAKLNGQSSDKSMYVVMLNIQIIINSLTSISS